MSTLSTWPTIAQTAEAFQVSPLTVRRWIADGRIDARRIGPRMIRINPDSLAVLGTPLTVGEVAE